MSLTNPDGTLFLMKIGKLRNEKKEKKAIDLMFSWLGKYVTRNVLYDRICYNTMKYIL